MACLDIHWNNYQFMNESSVKNPVQYNFEKMWTRAASESRNLKVLRLLLREGFKFYCSIHHAIEHDDVELCQILFENGYNLDAISAEKGITAMHLAARSGSLKVAQLLVDMGHKVNTFDASGMSPLHAAIDASKIEMVKYLANVGGPTLVNTCAEIDDGVTALSLATSQHKIKIIKILLNCSADIYIRNFDQSTLLHVAAKCKVVDILKFYLSIWNSNLDPVRGDTQISPLEDAVSAKSLKSFAYLLDAGCKYDAKVILKEACSVGSVEVINALVQRGIAMEADQFRRKKQTIKSILSLSVERCQGVLASKYDWTPLNVCILNNHNKMARFLVDRAGYSVDLCTNWGQSPFYVAAGEMGNLPLAKFLLARHAHWDIRLKSSAGTSARTGFSALHRAVQRADIDAVKFLIGFWGPESMSKGYLGYKKEKKGKLKNTLTLPSCVDQEGSNPLHIAATVVNRNILEIINILVSVRPDWLNARDNQQRIPLDVVYMVSRSHANPIHWPRAYDQIFDQIMLLETSKFLPG
ncbi:Ankyrin repeat domain-containing protein 44 [Blyttiomyces sp. JEL0837]|nr:Ankyrin repeat domain-containing protein 44 [Blyttiomyces sp. JEL0837]